MKKRVEHRLRPAPLGSARTSGRSEKRVPCSGVAAPCLHWTLGRPEGDVRPLPLLSHRIFFSARWTAWWSRGATFWRGGAASWWMSERRCTWT